jgi:aryl-alcohol dehydrogenase-like predicted oxidoreductase
MLVKQIKKHGRVGLGGEGVLRTRSLNVQARDVIMAAIEHGITYFDSARVYSDSELYYGSVWRKFPERRAEIFQTSKSASRDKRGALADLEASFLRIETNYLDLWQIHDVRTKEDIASISAPGGALEAFIEAKTSGKVRFIGVTGHHDPEVLTTAVRNWPVDSVMMPVNPVEEILGGFLSSTLPAAKTKGIAVIAMKILGASHFIHKRHGITAELLIRYALSQDISMAIVGCSTPAEVKTLFDSGKNFKPLAGGEKTRLLRAFKPYAPQLAYYRGVI